MADPTSGSSPLGQHKNGNATLTVDAKEEIKKRINDLLSDDYVVQAESINELEKYGEEAAELLVDTLIKKSSRPDLHDPLTTALEEIGKPSVTVLLNALAQFGELKRPEDVYLLDSLVETLYHLKDRRAVPALLQQISKLNRCIQTYKDTPLGDLAEATKVRLHVMLVELGVKDGLEDLLSLLGDGRKRIRDGVVEALTKAGDKRALIPLLRLYEVELPVSFSGAHEIKTAFREIAKREKVGHDDPCWQALTEAERKTFEKLYSRSRAPAEHPTPESAS